MIRWIFTKCCKQQDHNILVNCHWSQLTRHLIRINLGVVKDQKLVRQQLLVTARPIWLLYWETWFNSVLHPSQVSSVEPHDFHFNSRVLAERLSNLFSNLGQSLAEVQTLTSHLWSVHFTNWATVVVSIENTTLSSNSQNLQTNTSLIDSIWAVKYQQFSLVWPRGTRKEINTPAKNVYK